MSRQPWAGEIRTESTREGPHWDPDQLQERLVASSAVLGGKWHLVIVDQLLRHGPLGFNELEDRIGNVSSKVLSESLERLGSKGIIERKVVSDRPVRVEYEVSSRGRLLQPIVAAIREDFDAFDWATGGE